MSSHHFNAKSKILFLISSFLSFLAFFSSVFALVIYFIKVESKRKRAASALFEKKKWKTQKVNFV